MPAVTQQERVENILKHEAYFQNSENQVISLTNLLLVEFLSKKQIVTQ